MSFDKKKFVLVFTKYTSYFLNIVLVGAVLGIVYFWVTTLMIAAK